MSSALMAKKLLRCGDFQLPRTLRVNALSNYPSFEPCNAYAVSGSARPASTSSAAARSRLGKQGQPMKKVIPAHGPSSFLRQALKARAGGEDKAPDGPEGQVIAYSTAERYDVRALQQRLVDRGVVPHNLLGEAIWIEEGGGEVFIFESGTFIAWNLPEATVADFLSTVIRARTVPLVEHHAYAAPEREDLPLLRSSSASFGVRDDMVVLGPLSSDSKSSLNSPSSSMTTDTRRLLSPLPPLSPSPAAPSTTRALEGEEPGLLLARLAVSAALSRACKLSTYEEQLSSFLARIAHVPGELKKGNDTPIRKKEIVRRFGELLELRQGLSLREENLVDSPELFWEDSTEERYFYDTLRAFDFTRRIKILNDKLEMTIELQSFLNQTLESRTSHRLEWIIILLILFEVIHVIWREGMPFLDFGSRRTKQDLRNPTT